jgi:hypothetical protein
MIMLTASPTIFAMGHTAKRGIQTTEFYNLEAQAGIKHSKVINQIKQHTL